MITVQEIEKAITQLPDDDMLSLRNWFDEYEAQKWDDQIEKDAFSGNLDKLANEAIADFRAGKCREL